MQQSPYHLNSSICSSARHFGTGSCSSQSLRQSHKACFSTTGNVAIICSIMEISSCEDKAGEKATAAHLAVHEQGPTANRERKIWGSSGTPNTYPHRRVRAYLLRHKCRFNFWIGVLPPSLTSCVLVVFFFIPHSFTGALRVSLDYQSWAISKVYPCSGTRA